MIRCLVADDSRAFRAILRAVLGRAPDVEVVGEAADGHEAVAQVIRLRPDVVTMDVRMPRKDGLAAIDEIMHVRPTPVIVVSAEVGPENQEIAFRALDAGAIEVLAKPRGGTDGSFERDAEAIRTAVRLVAKLKLVTRAAAARRGASDRTPPPPPGSARAAADAVARALAASGADRAPSQPAIPRVLGIAASTGGPAALAQILRALPRAFPVPLLVVQHIAAGFDGGLAHWLAGGTSLAVKLAEDGEPLRPGTVSIAPSGKHLAVSGDAVRLLDDPPVRGFKPSGDVLLSAIAREHGAGAAGLVLSGMGDDGAAGLAEVRARGGWTAAQGPQSSVVFGMPRVAIERGAAERTVELDEVPGALLRLARVERGGGG